MVGNETAESVKVSDRVVSSPRVRFFFFFTKARVSSVIPCPPATRLLPTPGLAWHPLRVLKARPFSQILSMIVFFLHLPYLILLLNRSLFGEVQYSVSSSECFFIFTVFRLKTPRPPSVFFLRILRSPIFSSHIFSCYYPSLLSCGTLLMFCLGDFPPEGIPPFLVCFFVSRALDCRCTCSGHRRLARCCDHPSSSFRCYTPLTVSNAIRSPVQKVGSVRCLHLVFFPFITWGLSSLYRTAPECRRLKSV